MTTSTQTNDRAHLASLHRSLRAQQVRLEHIRALEPARRQREALGRARIQYAVSAMAAFRERVRVFGLPTTGQAAATAQARR